MRNRVIITKEWESCFTAAFQAEYMGGDYLKALAQSLGKPVYGSQREADDNQSLLDKPKGGQPKNENNGTLPPTDFKVAMDNAGKWSMQSQMELFRKT